MANTFEKLSFTKDWNNSADFPTYEENEAKVRADLQALHDETKEFINEKLIPGIENLAVPGSGDMLAAVYDPNGKREDVFQYAEDKAAAITRESLGAASDTAFQQHIGNQSNPHNVTADQVAVSENVVNAFEQTGNWSVDGILSQIGSTLFGGDVPRIQTGSYTGTGTSGSANPCSLTFSFAPKLVWITGGGYKALFFASELTESYAENGYLNCSTTSLGANAGLGALVDANTLKWYGYSAATQMNTSGVEYTWCAIG